MFRNSYRSILKISTTAIVLQLGVWFESKSQGCSDAGFCTIGSLRQEHADSSRHPGHQLTFLLPVGTGDENVFVFAPAVQYDFQFSGNWALQAKVTGNYANGNLGTASGLGDIFVSGTRTFSSGKAWKTSATLGVKFFLNSGNIEENGLSLPMQYQSSLGTIDMILGASFTNDAWQFSIGLQQPLSGENSNAFLPGDWNSPEADKYPPSNKLSRKGDALLRAAYMFHIKKSVTISTGLLGIYHLTNDTYVDESVTEKPITIKGSQGLTLNGTVTLQWKVDENFSLGFLAGMPFVVRDVRPDGLTRHFVFAPEIKLKF